MREKARRSRDTRDVAVTTAQLRSVRRLVFIVLVVGLVAGLLVIASGVRARIRTTPVYVPPVLAGQPVS